MEHDVNIMLRWTQVKVATRLLPCVDTSYLETLDRPKHVNCSWMQRVMGCQHHVIMLRHILETVHTLRFFVHVMFRRSVYSSFARHSSLQFMLGNVKNERLLLKCGDDFGLYWVFCCGYRMRVLNVQSKLQNELLNNNVKPAKIFKEALLISRSPGC